MADEAPKEDKFQGISVEKLRAQDRKGWFVPAEVRSRGACKELEIFLDARRGE
jgi:hypothetical protein